jgi:methionyl aminopeptidase
MIPIGMQFPDGKFPEGEIVEYQDANRKRTTGAEYREKERLFTHDYEALRKSAEAHRQVRKYAQSIIKPGMKLVDICNEIENTNRRLIEANKIEAGIAFPTGCSINNCAAHYTPNPGDMRVLEKDDVMKIDFGTHVRGLLVDCAFTVSFNPIYDDLLKAVKEATNTGIQHAGIDARLNEIGEAIQETMESFEITLGNKTHQIKSVKNLCGHLIA